MYSWERQHRGWSDTDSNTNEYRKCEPDGYGYEFTYRHDNPNSHVDGYGHLNSDALSDPNRNRPGNPDAYQYGDSDQHDIANNRADAHSHWHAKQHTDDDADSDRDTNSTHGAGHHWWSPRRFDCRDGDGNPTRKSKFVHQCVRLRK